MPFDEDQLTAKEEYPCEKCSSGNVGFNNNTGCWECDSCDFAATPPEEIPDINYPGR